MPTARLRRTLPASLALFALFGLAPAAAHADFIAVCWDGEIVLIDEVTGTAQLLGVSTTTHINALARVEPRGLLGYSNQPTAPRLLRVDPVLAETGYAGTPFLNDVRALGVDDQSRLYAVDDVGSAESWLYWLDLTVPAGDPSIKHFIGILPLDGVQGMGGTSNGMLYAWSVSYGLILIDPLTANATDINSLLDGSGSIQTLAQNPAGMLFGAGDRLYEIDTTTGQPTAIGPLFPFSVRGMEYWDPNSPTRYCAPKSNSLACVPSIAWSGTPSVSGPDDFHVLATNVLSHRAGRVLWSLTAQDLPFQGGHLCVGSALHRTLVQDSGGNPGVFDCSGSYSYLFSNAYMLSQGILPGMRVHAQYYSRDPANPDGVGLTDALRFTLLP